MCSYETKKSSCKKRMITFTFTRQEWNVFQSLRKEVKCAYTNAAFINVEDHDYYPAIERIDHLGAYSYTNCVWVIKKANLLKSDYIEKINDESELPHHLQSWLQRIRKILSDENNIEQVRQVYDQKLAENNKIIEKGENLMTNHSTEDTQKYTPENKELYLAQEYTKFGQFVEDTCGATFQLTFSQYKQFMNKRTCQLTRRSFKKVSPILWVVDKSLPVNKDNILVLDNSLQKGLDSLVAGAKLDKSALIKVCSGLVNL